MRLVTLGDKDETPVYVHDHVPVKVPVHGHVNNRDNLHK